MFGTSLGDLPRLRNCRRRRLSSYDKRGGNRDWWDFNPGEKKDIAVIETPGIIRHIWMTMYSEMKHFARKIVLRMFWDDEKEPSVEVPIGDFFGCGHGIIKDFWSLPLTMSPQDGRAFNCFFSMPFYKNARIQIENQGEQSHTFYFYIDYEEYKQLEPGLAIFHSQWRRTNPTKGWGEDDDYTKKEMWEKLWDTPTDFNENYVILEAEGKGQYVGCNLNIDAFTPRKNKWYGEGDDMIFIDGEKFPSLYGTGTEDYFNTAFGPWTEFSAPYHGIIVNSGDEKWRWKGKNTVFRFHIEDPVMFEKSIKVTIEHGTANNLANDYSSTAYWYQTEPHKKFPLLLPVEERLPREDVV